MPDSASGVSKQRVLAELGGQAVGDPEDAAERADVLAEDEHRGVLGQRVAQRPVEGLGHGQLLDARRPAGTSSGVGRSSARSSRAQLVGHDARLLRAAAGCGAAYTWREQVVGVGLDVAVEPVAQVRRRPARPRRRTPAPVSSVSTSALAQVGLAARVSGSRSTHAATSASCAVAGRVVGVGVGLHAVGVRLDRAAALPRRGPARRPSPRTASSAASVVAVDPLAGHAVADALVRQRGRDGLPGQRHARWRTRCSG